MGLYSRLLIAVKKDNEKKYRFAIEKVVPDTTDWGGYHEEFLCYQSRVLTVCFVARIKSTFFAFGQDERPPSCASIKFKFLREKDLEMARKLVYDKAKPPVSEYHDF